MTPTGESRIAMPPLGSIRVRPLSSQTARSRRASPRGTLRLLTASRFMAVRAWDLSRPEGVSISGPFGPAREVGLLFGRQGVDPNAHGLELQPGDLAIDGGRNGVDLTFEALPLLHQVLCRQRLVGKRHVHHGRRVAFGRREVDQASLAEQVHAPPGWQSVLIDVVAQALLAPRGDLFQG